jgi:hypothetical protein
MTPQPIEVSSSSVSTHHDDCSSVLSSQIELSAASVSDLSKAVLAFSEDEPDLFCALFEDIPNADQILATVASDTRSNRANALFSKAVDCLVPDSSDDKALILRLARVAKLLTAARSSWVPPQHGLADLLGGVTGPAIYKAVLDAMVNQDSSDNQPAHSGRRL